MVVVVVLIYFGWTKMKRLFSVEERRGSAPQPESPCEYLAAAAGDLREASL